MPTPARAAGKQVTNHEDRRAEGTSAPVPDRPSRSNLREAVQRCRACELWQGATQAVIGEGAPDAEVMLVGEQPSAILRAHDVDRTSAMDAFVGDLANVRSWLSAA